MLKRLFTFWCVHIPEPYLETCYSSTLAMNMISFFFNEEDAIISISIVLSTIRNLSFFYVAVDQGDFIF
jgi:hypothetical protein